MPVIITRLSSNLLSKSLKVRIYKTVLLPVVLYGCETWTLTLREEHRLRVFENKVLRKIFGAKRDEVTGEWRNFLNTELHALYSSPDIIRNIKSRRLRWAGHVARMGESRNAYRVLVGRPKGQIPLGRPRRRWEDNIKMDLREVVYDGNASSAKVKNEGLKKMMKEISKVLTGYDSDEEVNYIVLAGCSTLKKKSPGRNSIALRLSEATVRSRSLRLLSLGPFEGQGVLQLRSSYGRAAPDCEYPVVSEMRDEVTGEWKKLHNAELHALYPSPDIIRNIKSRRLRWAGHVASMGESRNAYRVLVGRPEGKRPLGRPKRRWEDNIKMDLREVGYDGRDWINLAQDRDRWRAYVRAAMNLRVP
ncbi:hypothetical protein ANN_23907 [Periplaneta americana]|uniref:Uncharacterized protein n=1 Tax=Periplaneta americana TaxID=6978 RepID=A0ABQ8S1L4_PERAM|nr:hypothetical protein ANN_23907 [Periplaneta americana]